MKLKFLSLVSAAFLALSSQTFAGDLYLIGHPNSLVTASYSDLQTFMALNARGVKPAVRNLYKRLASQGLLFNLHPGDRVNVVGYYDDGIAEITWGNGAYRGFINKDDLTNYLGSWKTDDEYARNVGDID